LKKYLRCRTRKFIAFSQKPETVKSHTHLKIIVVNLRGNRMSQSTPKSPNCLLLSPLLVKFNIIFFQWLDSPPHCRGFVIALRHATLFSTPLASGQPAPVTSTWQHIHPQETDIHAPEGIWTRSPRKQAATVPRLRSRSAKFNMDSYSPSALEVEITSLNKLQTNKSLSRQVLPEADQAMHNYDVCGQHPFWHNRIPPPCSLPPALLKRRSSVNRTKTEMATADVSRS
jgi:hypothetical protein